MMSSGVCVAAVCYSRSHFTGKERDTESGNDYFGARYFGSNMGRFLSPDPSGLYYADQTNPQSFNLYAYVQDNPLKNTDPDGLRCVWDDGSFDSEDDPQTGKQSDCEAAGGTYHAPGTYAAGVDWASTDSDGTLDLHGAGSQTTVTVTATNAAIDLVGSSLPGWIADDAIAKIPLLPLLVDPYRLFSTHYCGPGGAGSASGAIDPACKTHDECYAAAGISAVSNIPGGPAMSSSQASAAKACNQAIYNAARANPNAPGSKALQWWLTQGSNIPFKGGYILLPGTEAKTW